MVRRPSTIPVFLWQPSLLETSELHAPTEHSQRWLTLEWGAVRQCPAVCSECRQPFLASSSSPSQGPDGVWPSWHAVPCHSPSDSVSRQNRGRAFPWRVRLSDTDIHTWNTLIAGNQNTILWKGKWLRYYPARKPECSRESSCPMITLKVPPHLWFVIERSIKGVWP